MLIGKILKNIQNVFLIFPNLILSSKNVTVTQNILYSQGILLIFECWTFRSLLPARGFLNDQKPMRKNFRYHDALFRKQSKLFDS